MATSMRRKKLRPCCPGRGCHPSAEGPLVHAAKVRWFHWPVLRKTFLQRDSGGVCAKGCISLDGNKQQVQSRPNSANRRGRRAS